MGAPRSRLRSLLHGPVSLTFAAGLGVTGLAGWFTGKLDVIVCTAAAVGMVALGLLTGRRRRTAAPACQADGACGRRPDS